MPVGSASRTASAAAAESSVCPPCPAAATRCVRARVSEDTYSPLRASALPVCKPMRTRSAATSRQGSREQRPLRRQRCGQRVAGGLEHRADAVADNLEHAAAVRADGVGQQRVMPLERRLHRVGVLLEEPRRALDVGEQEGDACRSGNALMQRDYTRRCSRWSMCSRIVLTAAANTTMTSVTAMISSTLCRPMPFMSR